MRPVIAAIAAATALGLGVQAQQPAADFGLVPRPSSLTAGSGSFTLTRTAVIAADTPVVPVARLLAGALAPAMGFTLDVRTGGTGARNAVVLRVRAPLASRLGPEGYELEATRSGVTITAATPAGAFYGTQTLRQLLPPEIFRDTTTAGVAWSVPAVSITDAPRFSWRGAHLDVSRHFMPKAFVERYIDLLALHKLNRFHWHLTDDQGWRLEIPKYPKLTEIGAWRKETLVGHESNDPTKIAFDGTRYGGFYTQADVREVVAYAAARFVTVVPEIEMPGHSQEVVAAYPELGSTTQPAEVRTRWGVSQFLLSPTDASVHFMQDVLTDVLALFPSPWIHVGGDEANKTQWQQNPQIQARLREIGAKSDDEGQAWFIRQMDGFLTSHGRRLIGWDEILDGGLAPNATVMSWRGLNGAIAAAKAGHDTVLTPTNFTYFDYYQSRDTAHEPLAIGNFLPLDRVYGWEPMPTELSPAEQKHVLGVQGQVWTEYLPTPSAVEYMAFPRLSALAEVAWSPNAGRSFDEFRTRLFTHLVRLHFLHVNFRPLDKTP